MNSDRNDGYCRCVGGYAGLAYLAQLSDSRYVTNLVRRVSISLLVLCGCIYTVAH